MLLEAGESLGLIFSPNSPQHLEVVRIKPDGAWRSSHHVYVHLAGRRLGTLEFPVFTVLLFTVISLVWEARTKYDGLESRVLL